MTRKSKIEVIISKILTFNRKRGWKPLPSDIAKSLVIESSELLEHFQWDESDKYQNEVQKKNWEEISEEVADVFWYLVTFCNASGIKLDKVVQDKINKLEIKYPSGKFKGKHNDKFYKEQKRKYRLNKK